MIRALSSADQRRRRPGPVRISSRRNPPFASSLTSNIRIARSPLSQANQALPRRPLNKGGGATLTVEHHRGRNERLEFRNKSEQLRINPVQRHVLPAPVIFS